MVNSIRLIFYHIDVIEVVKGKGNSNFVSHHIKSHPLNKLNLFLHLIAADIYTPKGQCSYTHACIQMIQNIYNTPQYFCSQQC